jgi:hypothetical protein
MTRAEVMAEVEWMLDFGMHPAFICSQIQRSVDAVTRMAYRAQNRRVVAAFTSDQFRQRCARQKEMA